jgi:hypothetical protein
MNVILVDESLIFSFQAKLMENRIRIAMMISTKAQIRSNFEKRRIDAFGLVLIRKETTDHVEGKQLTKHAY